MTTTLIRSADTFDQDTTFVIETKGFRRMKRMTVRLMQGYDKRDDGIFWGMQCSACLKAEYTAKDYEESARLNSMEPVRHGDTVTIEGKQYKARVLGDYSNCAVFDPIEA